MPSGAVPVVCVALLAVYVEAAEVEPAKMSGGAGQVRKYPPGRIGGGGGTADSFRPGRFLLQAA